jgi:hypothetical protein
MKQKLLEELLPQVRENCLVSDARYWGHYSVCGLLLRLREQYRFEKRIPPSESIEREDIGRWIGRREALWEEMREQEYSPLKIGGEEFDPFDTAGINGRINGRGLLYGGGYGVYLKPLFFLADLDGVRSIDGLPVFTAGREYARDLALHPAMLREGTAIARRDAAHVLIRERFEEFRAMNSRGALALAFESYGVAAATAPGKLREVADAELLTFVHHELGEAHETERSGGLWAEMLTAVGHGRESLFLRGLKDTLADASERGMLRHIIDCRKAGSLAFYVAALNGYRKTHAAEVERAFGAFVESGDWEGLESAREACYRNARSIADDLLGTYQKGKDAEELSAAVKRRLIQTCPRRPQ